MSFVTYKHEGLQPFKITVKVFNRIAGYIEKDADGYFYYPKGRKKFRGDSCKTLSEVKRYLEAA